MKGVGGVKGGAEQVIGWQTGIVVGNGDQDPSNMQVSSRVLFYKNDIQILSTVSLTIRVTSVHFENVASSILLLLALFLY